MNKLTATEELNQRISSLQNKKVEDMRIMKQEFHNVYESMKPMNLIKKAIHEISSAPDLKNNLVDGAIGMGTGFLTKKLLVGNSLNPIKNILGNVIEYAIANVVSKHTDGIKSTGISLIQKFLTKKKDKPELAAD